MNEESLVPTPPSGPEIPNKDKGRKKYIIVAVLIIAAVAAIVTVLFATHIICINHQWLDATCVQPQICSRCGRERGEPLGHDWATATCTKPETCSRCHEVQGEAFGHEWVPATCTQPESCSRCSATQGKALGHSGHWETTKAATLNTYGTEQEICSVCQEVLDSKTLRKDPSVSSQSFNFGDEEFITYLDEHTSDSYSFLSAGEDLTSDDTAADKTNRGFYLCFGQKYRP